jgi:hypothetical protein
MRVTGLYPSARGFRSQSVAPDLRQPSLILRNGHRRRSRTESATSSLEISQKSTRSWYAGYGFWKERFGGCDDVLSQSVEMSGVPWQIVGVAPPGFDFPAGARFWIPVRNDEQQCGRGCVFLNGIGRLADGVSLEAAQEEMKRIAEVLEREYPQANYDTTVMVQTLQQRTVGSVQLALLVLLGAVPPCC